MRVVLPKIALPFLNRELFFFFCSKVNALYRSGHELGLYRSLIEKHRLIENPGILFEEPFCRLVMSTLEAWNMNQRGARLAPFDRFLQSVENNKQNLVELHNYRLETIHFLSIDERDEIFGLLKTVFSSLSVMDSKRRIVGVSKAMHFLLPDLVLPIDSSYTLPVFCGYNRPSNDLDQELDTFTDVFLATVRVSKNLNLTVSDVEGAKWNTSIPKLIDNATIGATICEVSEIRGLIEAKGIQIPRENWQSFLKWKRAAAARKEKAKAERELLKYVLNHPELLPEHLR